MELRNTVVLTVACLAMGAALTYKSISEHVKLRQDVSALSGQLTRHERALVEERRRAHAAEVSEMKARLAAATCDKRASEWERRAREKGE